MRLGLIRPHRSESHGNGFFPHDAGSRDVSNTVDILGDLEAILGFGQANQAAQRLAAEVNLARIGIGTAHCGDELVDGDVGVCVQVSHGCLLPEESLIGTGASIYFNAVT
jgi:hypothetical protein